MADLVVVEVATGLGLIAREDYTGRARSSLLDEALGQL
jgi:hypothetical protein